MAFLLIMTGRHRLHRWLRGSNSPGLTIASAKDGQPVELARLSMAVSCGPAIDSVLPLSEARAAFECSMAEWKRGKVVLGVVDD